MDWKDIKPRVPSRYERMTNGDRDHVSGIDDGECHISERPVGYYNDEPFTTGNPAIDAMDEGDVAAALPGGIY